MALDPQGTPWCYFDSDFFFYLFRKNPLFGYFLYPWWMCLRVKSFPPCSLAFNLKSLAFQFWDVFSLLLWASPYLVFPVSCSHSYLPDVTSARMTHSFLIFSLLFSNSLSFHSTLGDFPDSLFSVSPINVCYLFVLVQALTQVLGWSWEKCRMCFCSHKAHLPAGEREKKQLISGS